MILGKIRGWLAPPVFQDNIHMTSTAWLVHSILLVDILLVVIGTLLDMGTGSSSSLMHGLQWLAIGLMTLPLILLHYGRVKPAAFAMLLLFTALITAVLYFIGPLQTPLVAAYMLIVITAVLTINRRAMMFFIALIGLCISCLIWLNFTGRLPEPSENITMTHWVAYAGIVVYAGLFTYWMRENLQRNLRQAQEELNVRRQAEDNLRRTSDFLLGIINALDDPVVVKDSAHRFVQVNNAFCLLMGRTREDLLGKTDRDLMPEADADVYWRQDEHVLHTGETAVYEENIYPNGKVLTISAKKSRYVDPSSGAQFITMTIRDITERIKVEEALSMSYANLEQQVVERTAELREMNTSLLNEVAERRVIEDALRRAQNDLETLMNAIPVTVCMFDGDGNLLRWNKQYEDLLGYTPDELRSMDGLYTIAPSDRRMLMDALHSASDSGIAQMELRMLRKDGREVPLYASGTPLYDEMGRKLFAGIGLDISDLKAIEAALNNSQRELASLMEVVPGVVCVFAGDGKIVRWNRHFETLLGYSAEEVEELDGYQVIRAADHALVDQAFQQVIEEGRAQLELHLIARDGQEIPMFAHWSYFNVVGEKHYIASVGLDISNIRAAEEALRESEERYRTLVEAFPDLILVLGLDGKVLYANPALHNQTGLLIEDLDLPWDEIPYFNAEEDLGGWGKMATFVESGQERSAAFETRITDKKGNLHWYSTILTRVQYRGAPAVQAISRDITEQKLAEMALNAANAALRESEERYALASRGANDGLWDRDLLDGGMYLSPRWKAMIGFLEGDPTAQTLEQFWMDRIHPEDLPHVQGEISAHLGGSSPHMEVEFRLMHKDGSYRWMLLRGLAVRGEDGRPYRMAGSMTDITERKRVEAQLLHDAFHDSLTGLPNRALLTDRLEQALLLRRRYPDSHFAVLYMDLDRFKDINDSLGHTTGDQMLVAAARRVQSCLRISDTLARLGGDEFVILLNEANELSDAISVADRIQTMLCMPFEINGMVTHTSVSIGIVFSETMEPDTGQRRYPRPEEILRNADIAMYRAKANGKACYQVYDPSMHSQVLWRMQMETDLRKALEEETFEIHYMPIIEIRTGKFKGIEALVRWQHPQRGLVPPGDFVPLAEESGLIIPLDRWVCERACRQVVEWQHQFGQPFELSINFSGKQFAQPDLIRSIEGIIAATGIDTNMLRLEITESALMENLEQAMRMLREIRSLGVQVEVDDFGTGYLSFTHLLQLPFSTLKIDRTFISPLGLDMKKTELVRAMVSMAHIIGMEVVAEGIESKQQVQVLKDMGCDLGQGFLISRPLDKEATEALLEKFLM